MDLALFVKERNEALLSFWRLYFDLNVMLLCGGGVHGVSHRHKETES